MARLSVGVVAAAVLLCVSVHAAPKKPGSGGSGGHGGGHHGHKDSTNLYELVQVPALPFCEHNDRFNIDEGLCVGIDRRTGVNPVSADCPKGTVLHGEKCRGKVYAMKGPKCRDDDAFYIPPETSLLKKPFPTWGMHKHPFMERHFDHVPNLAELQQPPKNVSRPKKVPDEERKPCAMDDLECIQEREQELLEGAGYCLESEVYFIPLRCPSNQFKKRDTDDGRRLCILEKKMDPTTEEVCSIHPVKNELGTLHEFGGKWNGSADHQHLAAMSLDGEGDERRLQKKGGDYSGYSKGEAVKKGKGGRKRGKDAKPGLGETAKVFGNKVCKTVKICPPSYKLHSGKCLQKIIIERSPDEDGCRDHWHYEEEFDACKKDHIREPVIDCPDKFQKHPHDPFKCYDHLSEDPENVICPCPSPGCKDISHHGSHKGDLGAVNGTGADVEPGTAGSYIYVAELGKCYIIIKYPPKYVCDHAEGFKLNEKTLQCQMRVPKGSIIPATHRKSGVEHPDEHMQAHVAFWRQERKRNKALAKSLKRNGGVVKYGGGGAGGGGKKGSAPPPPKKK
ncbi:unnamed protein product [Vitrella brassicaformis CCMP3155]|uniref:Oocyst wall protein n=1 Tax=Vitrella brassicaformis (strain CCMP3155) TaxID=1169540 RepID=A0A0G4GID8_VITBC|nr:unnamed protein product [Vitrella brassicaformis CCMP3155]|eukprot:CEM29599.1 unnamed protein product [Vitrella brassicaformis CCMP3155]